MKTLKSLIIIFSVIIMGVTPVISGGITGRSAFIYGARPFGMGKAFTAVDGDIVGALWNPAGLGSIENLQVISSYDNPGQLTWIKRLYLGVGMPTPIGVHAFSISDNSTNYDFKTLNIQSSFNKMKWSEQTLNYTFSTKLSDASLLGINFGYETVKTDIQNANAKGYRLDAGFISKISDQFSIGVAARNLYNKKKWDTGNTEKDELEYSAGIRCSVFPRLHLTADLFGGKQEHIESLNVGGEFIIWSSFLLQNTSRSQSHFEHLQRPHFPTDLDFIIRAGMEKVMYGEKETNFSTGLTLKVGATSLDYAMVMKDNNLMMGEENTHYFSLGVSFGKPAGEEKKDVKKVKSSDIKKSRQTLYHGQKKIKVAVVDFQNIGTDNLFPWLAAGISNMVTANLTQHSNLEIRDRDEINEMTSLLSLNVEEINAETAAQLGILINADLVVVGTYKVGRNNNIIINIKVFATDVRTPLIEKRLFDNVNSITRMVNRINKEIDNLLLNYDKYISMYAKENKYFMLSQR